MSAPIPMMHTVETQTLSSRTATGGASSQLATTPYPAPRHHAISAAAGSNPVTANGAAQKVLAERYKTKICKKFIELGMCPYESRCMFAHGEDELRTAEMNLHDGIVTEDAIRHFKRMQAYKQQAGSASAPSTNSSRPPSYDVTASSFSDEYSEYYNQSLHRKNSNFHSGSSSSFSSPMNRKSSGSLDSLCMSFNTSGSSFSFNPYGWTPFHNATNPECECADCLYSAEAHEYTHSAYVASTHQSHEEEEDEEEYSSAMSKPVMNNKLPQASSQSDLIGHALHRPTMP